MILRICFYSSLLLLSSIDILEQKIPNSYLYFLFIFIFTNLISSDYFSLPGRLEMELILMKVSSNIIMILKLKRRKKTVIQIPCVMSMMHGRGLYKSLQA